MYEKDETCHWCGKNFIKNAPNQIYCCWKCGDEVNSKRALYRYHGKTFSLKTDHKQPKRQIIEKHEYTSELQKWRSER